jgi:8-oxo-dGTP pyrophosphatase MutT (NUDIX family)
VHVLLTQRSSALRSHGGDVSFPGGRMDSTDDGVADCALREANEEVGLPRVAGDTLPRSNGSGARVMTTGRSAVSKNGLEVVPIVAQIPVPSFLLSQAEADTTALSVSSVAASAASSVDSFHPSLNSAEVSVLFSVPLVRFLDSGRGYAFNDITWHGRRVRMHEFLITLPRTEWMASSAELARVEALGPVEREEMTTERNFRVWGLTAYMLVAAAMQLLGHKPAFATVAAMQTTDGKTQAKPSKL